MSKRTYMLKNVLEAARDRISYLFDEFETISVSVSGGKDSCVLFHLAYEEAKKRRRKIECYFLDEEAIYESTVGIIQDQMQLDLVTAKWFQLPIRASNATSWSNCFLDCFSPDREPLHGWQDIAIKEMPGHPDRFYKFHDWYPTTMSQSTAMLIGLRSAESLNRYRAVIKNPGYKKINWSTKTKVKHVAKFYPLYDWGFDDIWRYIYDQYVEYSCIYDYQHMKAYSIKDMRISSLLHEMSFKSLVDLPEFEPDTFQRLSDLVPGVKTARIYAKEATMYKTNKLPHGYESWMAYRDWLLENLPNPELQRIYREKFKEHINDNPTAQQQVRMMLINDWENTAITIDQTKQIKRQEKVNQWINDI